MECFESAVPAIFLPYAPTFFEKNWLVSRFQEVVKNVQMLTYYGRQTTKDRCEPIAIGHLKLS